MSAMNRDSWAVNNPVQELELQPPRTKSAMQRSISKDTRIPGEAKLTTVDRLKEKLVQSLPLSAAIDIEDLDRLGWSVHISSLHILLYGVVLFYFVASGTITEVAKKYVALEAPSSALATCEEVPAAITATFRADMRGVWNSQLGFDNSAAIYQLQMTATEVTHQRNTGRRCSSLRASCRCWGRNNPNPMLSSLSLHGIFFAASRSAPIQMLY